MSRALCIVVLVLLAVLHSVLGERKLLGPLFAAGLPQGVPPLRGALARRTLRLSWHLLSIAWVSLAALVARGDGGVLTVVGAMLLLSGLLSLAISRGRHFAWALFTVGGAAGLLGPHVNLAGTFAAGLAAALLMGIAALHVSWLLGSRWGLDSAIPEVKGRPAFNPPRGLTAVVAAAFGAAGALVVIALRAGPPWSWLSLAGAGVFALRALGDFRLVGLTKRVRGTAFARWDDGLYTPLSVLLAILFSIVGARGLT